MAVALSMSASGTFRTCPNFWIESAFGCKAEVGSRNSEGPLLAQSRPRAGTTSALT